MTAPVPTWRLYRFDTDLRCPHCGVLRRLYIGISNEPLRRVVEHAKDKWWFRHVTGWTVDERVFYSEADARSAEKAAIHAERPLCNDQHNRANPCRMLPSSAGRPVPRAAAGTAMRGRRGTAARQGWSLPPAAAARLERVAWWLVSWAVLTVALMAVGGVWLHMATSPAFHVAGPGAAALLAVGRWLTWSRRMQRKARRWAGAVLVAAAVFGAVWVVLGAHASQAVSR